MKLYVDAEIMYAPGKALTYAFGPLSSRESAEKALIAIAARENVMGAIIRDPDSGRS